MSCGAPSLTLKAMASVFGSDACFPFPFGGLIIQKSGKECRNIKAMQLILKETNQAVPMFIVQ